MSAEHINEISKIIDTKFCEKILRKCEGDNEIEVNNVTIKAATSKGDNYTSEMFRASVECKDKQNKSIIVKVLPMTQGFQQDMISQSSLFSTEILMMSDALKKMNSYLSPEEKLSGRGLYTQGNPPLLAIEDLSPLGFRMVDRQAGLDLNHSILAIKGLARFHATSVALVEKEPKQRKRFQKGLFDQNASVEAFFIQATQTLGQETSNWPDLHPDYPKKIFALADEIYKKGAKITECREGDFNVINHGDFWVNNMLFKYDERNQPISHIFVDFQLCKYTSPAIDLHYFFNTSLNDDMLLKNENLLLKEYRQELTKILSRTGCKVKPPSMTNLKRMMKERAFYGMIAAFTVLPSVLVEKSEVRNFDEMMGNNNGEYDNAGYAGKAYRQAMLRRLPKFNQLGLLD